jgi:DNA-binding transcriptional LysR family regulator
MNLRQLRYVVATADHGTMTAAAEAMYVAQPALSRAVRELERELGLELFMRSGRGVVLTETGGHVVRYARDALRAVSAIETLAVAGPNGRGRELRIATTGAAGALDRLAMEFTRRAYGVPSGEEGQQAIRVRILPCENRGAITTAVREGMADLGVLDPPGPPDLVMHPFRQREVARIDAPPLKVTVGLVHVRRPLPPIVRDFLAFATNC